MKKFIIGILGIITFVLRLFGEVPSSLPIGSRALLQAYAFENSAEAKAGIGSASAISGGNTYFSKSVRNGSHAIEVLRTARFTFNVENVKNPANLWAQIEDKDGNVLMSGSDQKEVVMSQFGFYQVKDKALPMSYSPSLPIRFPGVQYAYVYIRDEEGKTIRQDNVPVRNGNILFPSAIAGEVSLKVAAVDESGKWVEYLYSKDGWRNVDPDRVFSGLEPKVENTAFVTDSHLNNVIVDSKNGYGNNTLFVLTLNQNQLVNFFAMTSEGYLATGYYIKKDKQPVNYWEIPKGFEVAHDLEWGTYYVWFTWNKDEFQEYQQWYSPPQNDGDGYGKGSSKNPTY